MKKLSESVWGDIRKKSLGQEDRLEENVDSIQDIDGLWDFIKERYKQTHPISRIGYRIKINLGVTYDSRPGVSNIYVEIFWMNHKKIMGINAPKVLMDELSKKYPISGGNIEQKDDNLKNSTIIGVIDTVLELIPNYEYMERLIDPK